MDAVIEARGLVKRFGPVTAVAGIDFEVRPGELFGFLGPNGAGKTTTINMLTGLARPDGGTIRIAGIDCSRDPKAAQHLVGNGPEFIAAALRRFLAAAGVETLYIEPGGAVGERVRGEFPQPAAGRTPGRGDLHGPAGREGPGGRLEERVRASSAALVAGVSDPGSLRGDACRACGRGCAPPSGPASEGTGGGPDSRNGWHMKWGYVNLAGAKKPRLTRSESSRQASARLVLVTGPSDRPAPQERVTCYGPSGYADGPGWIRTTGQGIMSPLR